MHNQRKIRVSLDALNEISKEYPEYVAQILQEVAAGNTSSEEEAADEILRWLDSNSSKEEKE